MVYNSIVAHCNAIVFKINAIMKKYPKSKIQNQLLDSPGYVSWDTKSEVARANAFKEMNGAVAEYTSVGRHRQDFSDLATNVSGRPGLTRQDYEYFRPSETLPRKRKDVLHSIERVYKDISLVRNIIDLMGDFACQGIRLVHPNKRTEKFYRNWFDRVNGKDRSERFLNNLYRTGSVIIRIQNAKVNIKTKQDLFKSFAAETKIPMLSQPRGEIPWLFTFLSPTVVEVIGGELGGFVGKHRYGLKLPDNLRKIIQSPKSQIERELVANLPDEIKAAAETRNLIVLPEDRTEVYHYKKDDWQTWATPMLCSTLVDLMMLEKLKLSDVAALDGAISNIRIFKLGSLDAKIAPTRAAVSKLAEILESHTGAGTMDLVWGPDIELVESNNTTHQFLGEAKYTPTLNNIYAGLGIPPTLTGTFGAAGTTNNFISLKTLIKRLEYGRFVLTSFWNKQIIKVQKGMGFRFPAHIEYSKMNLGDEEAEMALWVQLADRNLISDELLQHQFGHNPDMESVRIKRENRLKNNGQMTPKAGPWHDPQLDHSLKKVALQTQVVTPSEVGLELEDRKPNEKPGLELRSTPQLEKNNKGIPQQGRPKNSKDKEKRKQPRFTPKLKAIELWALNAQSRISDILNPIALSHFKKSHMRSLSSDEQYEYERMKFYTLCNIKPFSVMEPHIIYNALNSKPNLSQILPIYNQFMSELSNQKLNINDYRNIQATTYALIQESEDVEN